MCSEVFERLERGTEQRLHDVTIVVTESKSAAQAALATIEAAVAERLHDVEHRHSALQVLAVASSARRKRSCRPTREGPRLPAQGSRQLADGALSTRPSVAATPLVRAA